jgi:hypothetical protein
MGLPKDNPDAVMTPAPFLPGGRFPGAAFNAIFGPQLGVKRVYFARHDDQYFLVKDVSVSLHFGTMHPLSPNECFTWYVVQDGRDAQPRVDPLRVGSWRDNPEAIKFGYAVDERASRPTSRSTRSSDSGSWTWRSRARTGWTRPRRRSSRPSRPT